MRMTRPLVIQSYLTAVAFGGFVYAAFGPSLDLASSLLVMGLLLAPALVVYRMWPDTPSDTAMDVMRRG